MAVMEFQPQVGPSFGNLFHIRTEESIAVNAIGRAYQSSSSGQMNPTVQGGVTGPWLSGRILNSRNVSTLLIDHTGWTAIE